MNSLSDNYHKHYGTRKIPEENSKPTVKAAFSLQMLMLFVIYLHTTTHTHAESESGRDSAVSADVVSPRVGEACPLLWITMHGLRSVCNPPQFVLSASPHHKEVQILLFIHPFTQPLTVYLANAMCWIL